MINFSSTDISAEERDKLSQQDGGRDVLDFINNDGGINGDLGSDDEGIVNDGIGGLYRLDGDNLVDNTGLVSIPIPQNIRPILRAVEKRVGELNTRTTTQPTSYDWED